MTLPFQLQDIFKNKQKSYKMIVILSLLDEQVELSRNNVSLSKIKDRFLNYYRMREKEGEIVDQPPSKLALRWQQAAEGQIQMVIATPLDALGNILNINESDKTIGFIDLIWGQMDASIIQELREYALSELDQYHAQLATQFSLRGYFEQIFAQYISAKKELFEKHPLGILIRRTIPEELSNLPFIEVNFKIQGSVGQGNWANIPWIALLDKRITDTTQHGEYVVYLFSEDMNSLYLTLNQGVTVPIKEKGKKAGYEYLQQKVNEMRNTLELRDMQKDEKISLSSSGIGRDYQVSTVAYIRYDRNNLPNNDQLISDLQNFMENYKFYVNSVLQEPVVENELKATFKYTMAYLSYGQGIIYYLGEKYPAFITMDELVVNQVDVLKSGDDVKHPKERIRHIGRAFQELGLLKIEDNMFSLTELGRQYAYLFDADKWKLSEAQAHLVQKVLNIAENQTTNLIQVIKKAVLIAKELAVFQTEVFLEKFINIMGVQGDWVDITQKDRTKFMLNWLQELHYIIKSGNDYKYIVEKERKLLDTRPVSEKVKDIKAFIRQRGFQFPEHLIENYYLSLKTKPFVILAGISGTGKTRLVQLFAEAVGATHENGQFTLIPVRPDWSDPSDLIGYKELTGSFRAGRLTEVLLEASKPENRDKPYFICLDEMNLARVEHYFSDLLSLMETQEWKEGQIVTKPILTKESMDNTSDQVRFGDLSLPENLYIVGTVNMDETTHPFSKKVLDRANTLEFNYIDLNLFPELGNNVMHLNNFGLTPNSFLRSDYLWLTDAYLDYQKLIEKTTLQLVQINVILEDVHSHVGFRVRDAICFYMIYNERFQLMSEDEAFDLQLLQKILPRLQGSSSSIKRILLKLMQQSLLISFNLNEVMEDPTSVYTPWGSDQVHPKAKYPQSARKIAYMLRRFEEDGFTSFWLS